ncbi:UNVERIFIED_CONTAM: LINE-1 reverse transcriptase [Sesamum radiatum]|uniref:LINE-1 reverse transcriptase n=1 Tax=Sesamum radiatum TaxID=300843 RepID=A0AAW2JFB8_SESRA
MLVLKENRSPGPTKRIWRRLDRVLYSKEWAEIFNITRVAHLPRRLSDHHPLCIEASKSDNKKPSSFRFQNMWLHHHSFLQTVKQSWELPIEGYGMYKLQQKLYRTKELLKKWNREIFGNVFSTAQQAKQEATEAEKNFDRDPSEANLIALNKSNAVMVQALTMEAEYWRQKSNCKWLEAGERNTKYFHSLVKKKRMKSTIHRIMEGNQEITHPDRIRDSAASYFENLLSGQGAQPSASDFPFQFPKISEAIGNNLCSIPSEEDIKETVFSIDKNSVAGPDGFSSSFYHACWDFIARDIYDAVRDFFSGTPMPRSFTATTIVLIPKVDFPQTWNDFRPISLCNVTNKILSKLLYRRISQALPELISPSQSGFVPGRLISDNILLAQEMIHHLDLRYKNSNLVIKLDMSKSIRQSQLGLPL